MCQNAPFSKTLERCTWFFSLSAALFETATETDTVHSSACGPALLTSWGAANLINNSYHSIFLASMETDFLIVVAREWYCKIFAEGARPSRTHLTLCMLLPLFAPLPHYLLPALCCKHNRNGSLQCHSRSFPSPKKKRWTSLLDLIKTPIASHRRGPRLSAPQLGGQMTLITAKMSC